MSLGRERIELDRHSSRLLRSIERSGSRRRVARQRDVRVGKARVREGVPPSAATARSKCSALFFHPSSVIRFQCNRPMRYSR